MAGTQEVTSSQSETDPLGRRLRRARLTRRLRLADLAHEVECSESYLSKVENGRTAPSLRMLHRIATALGTSIAELFSESPAAGVVVDHAGERPVIRVSGGGADDGIYLEQMAPFNINRLLEAHVHVIAPRAENGGVIRHEGEEVGYVAEGEIDITIDGITYRLRQGDSFFFPSELPHSYRNAGSGTARVIWVSTPLTF